MATSAVQTAKSNEQIISADSPNYEKAELLKSILEDLSPNFRTYLLELVNRFLNGDPISEQDTLLLTATHALHSAFNKISYYYKNIPPPEKSSSERSYRSTFHAFALARHTLTELDAKISGAAAAARATGGTSQENLRQFARKQ